LLAQGRQQQERKRKDEEMGKNMPARPSNADLQRQLYSVQTEMRSCNTEVKTTLKEMNTKLDKALEHSAAHKARLDNHDGAIKEAKEGLAEEVKAREGQFMWVAGSGLTALVAFLVAMLEWVKGGR
jgi:seryl-tRNA synthetase